MTALQAALPSGLRWHCRRGMLELDLLLNAFLDGPYTDLSIDEKAQFKLMLDYPDQTLFDLLMGNMKSSDREAQLLVLKINPHLSSC